MAQINKVKLPNGTTYDIVPSASDITVKSKLYFEAVNEDNVTYKKLVAEYVPPDPEDIDTAGTLTVYNLDGNTMFTMDMNGNRFDLLRVVNTLIAGTLRANNLTANNILVSDANKNIVSSSLSVSDLITTSNIGSQSVNYATSAGSATNATKWNNLTDDSNKLNITDTWIPVYSSGKVQHCIREFWSNVQHCDYNNANKRSYLVTMSCLAFWNGAYNSNGASNFRYLGPTATIGGHTEIYKSGNTSVFGVATNGASIRAYGNVNTFMIISASQFVVNSSRIVKENIEPITEERAKKILNLNVVSFDYIEEVGGEKNKVGLIAEDTLDILPDVVTVPTNYNEEKTKQKIKNNEAADVMSIDYSKLTPYLIKMVQIQQRQIEELKAEVEKLKDVIEFWQ